jgi:hypothetical protein
MRADEPSITGLAMSQRARRCVFLYTLAHSDLIALVEIVTSDDSKYCNTASDSQRRCPCSRGSF